MALDDIKTLAERVLRLENKLRRIEERKGKPKPEVFDNSAIRNRKIIDDLLVHNHTHANLLGLDADDHTQYLNTTRHDVTDRHTLGTVVPHDSHSSLSNLSNDDHTQYTKHPASSTDNAIVRWDGTDGRTIQNSGVTIDDSNNIKVGTAPVPTSVTSSTDNAVVRFDGTGGNKIQNSLVTINDSGDITGKLINEMLINYQHVETYPTADVYIKLATLPKSASGTYASARMDGIIGSWLATEIAMYSFFAGNRDSEQFYFTYTGSKTNFYNARILAYKRSTGELDICHFVAADSYTTFSANLSLFQGTIERTPATFTPSGTKVFDSYEFTL